MAVTCCLQIGSVRALWGRDCHADVLPGMRNLQPWPGGGGRSCRRGLHLIKSMEEGVA